MLAWKISDPSREKLFSCGESPEGIFAVILPVRVSIEIQHAGRAEGVQSGDHPTREIEDHVVFIGVNRVSVGRALTAFATSHGHVRHA